MESIDDSKQSGKALVLKLGIDDSTLKDLAFNKYCWGGKDLQIYGLSEKAYRRSF